MSVGSGRREGREQKERKRVASLNDILYPSEMCIGGIGLQQLELGGILGNVLFCLNMDATCSTYIMKLRLFSD